jgi:hypothetical protein
MLKNVVTYLKLNKNQRTLRKASIVDDNGNLTDTGKDVLLNLLLEDNEENLANKVREYLKEEIDEAEDKN